ncbi:MAG: heavy metal-binding domain-containing protein [Bacteroidales bacterium]|nr:heavy metal-binding domain-containing protein [Bacteroidales bacterium]
MKRKLVTFGVATLFLIGAAFFTSCGNPENQKEHEQMDSTEHEHMSDKSMDENKKTEQTAAVYACPMHPEITGKEGDKCSKCGMALEKVEDDHSGHQH